MIKKSDVQKILEAIPFLELFLGIHKTTISREMIGMKEYIIDGVSNINKLQEKFNKSLQKQMDEFPNFADYNGKKIAKQRYQENTQHYQYKNLYPVTFNNSTLLTLYSFFEYNLKELCYTLNEHNKYNVTVDDLSGNDYIEKSKKYLKLVANVDVDKYDKDWKSIKEYQQIRNRIVHHNSSIAMKGKEFTQQSLYQYITKSNCLKLDLKNGNFNIIDHQYLLNFCNLIEKYIIDIIEEASKKIQIDDLPFS
jgi:hypothetical protein